MGTLTDATDGMLQEGDGNGCVKVVARENETVKIVTADQISTVARSSPAAVVARSQSVAVRARSTPIVERVVSQQTEVVVASRGCDTGGGAPPGPADWNTILNKPDTFPPSSHAHAVGDITGLEQRLPIVGTSFTFDVDTTNIDNGVTDPYKFISLSAALSAVLALVPRLPSVVSTITILLGDGDWDSYDIAVFFSDGAVGGIDYGYEARPGTVSNANARFVFSAKNNPTAIPNAAWSLISAGFDGAQRAAKSVTNRAIMAAAFPTRIVDNEAVWQSQYLAFPNNVAADGVAFMSTSTVNAYFVIRAPYILARGAGFYGTTGYWSESVATVNHSAKPADYPAIGLDGVVTYVVHGALELTAPSGNYAYQTLTIVNPVRAVVYPYNEAAFVVDLALPLFLTMNCLGSLKEATQGWFNIGAINFLSSKINPLSDVSGVGTGYIFTFTVFDNFKDVTFAINSGSKVFTTEKIRAYGYCAISLVGASYFPNREGAIVLGYPSAAPNVLYGTGSPNGVMPGKPGDLYTNLSGGAGATLWVKESGANTNTGWVAK